MKTTVAVLLTCHNRKQKTLRCLQTLYEATWPSNYIFDVFLVDDGSIDGTGIAVEKEFPAVNVINANGSLFWAGGMRLAWKSAIKADNFNVFLLLNDDVELKQSFFKNLIEADQFSSKKFKKKGIYSGATKDKDSNQISYGGIRITTNHFILKTQKLIPSELPQDCDMTNANILWVSKEVVDQIGIFDEKFTHGIADYEYTLRAKKNNIPVLLAPYFGGYCSDDHGNNWKSSTEKLKERIVYLKSPTGLAYSEYLYYIRKNFQLLLPYSFTMLWMKTFFPGLWNKFKK